MNPLASTLRCLFGGRPSEVARPPTEALAAQGKETPIPNVTPRWGQPPRSVPLPSRPRERVVFRAGYGWRVGPRPQHSASRQLPRCWNNTASPALSYAIHPPVAAGMPATMNGAAVGPRPMCPHDQPDRDGL